MSDCLLIQCIQKGITWNYIISSCESEDLPLGLAGFNHPETDVIPGCLAIVLILSD